MAAVGAVLLLAGLTLYIYGRVTAPAVAPDEHAKAAAAAPPAVPAAGPASSQDAPPPPAATTGAPQGGPPTAHAGPERHTLEIKAIEETWLKIIIDDQKAQEMTLKAGEVRQVNAKALFNLLIGNAGGVALELDGVPVEVSGKSGQVVNIQLP
jgi:hypothetical protein